MQNTRKFARLATLFHHDMRNLFLKHRILFPLLLLTAVFCRADSTATIDSTPALTADASGSTCCRIAPKHLFAGDFDDPHGFRGYRFGTQRFNVRGLGVKRPHGRNAWYQIDHGLRIGDSRLKELDYGFRDDRFYGVSALPANYRSYCALKSMLDSIHGAPMKTDSNESGVTYFWNVPDVSCKLRLYWGNYRMDGNKNEMIFSLISIPIAGDRDTFTETPPE